MKIHVAIVQPPPFALVFHELAKLLVLSLGDLGHDAGAAEGRPHAEARNIILGYGATLDPSVLRGHIIYQLEPLTSWPAESVGQMLERLRLASEVWEYSPRNIEFLRQHGIQAKLVPIGFHPGLASIVHHPDPQIDVLHYGNGSPRRAEIIRALDEKCRMIHIQGRFGAERDRYIGSAKIVLNVHYHPDQAFESVRVSYLLNNGCFVISEESADNPYADMIVTAPYERLVETCLTYLNRPQERQRIAQAALARFSTMRMSDILRAALS
jgi:hypothetical protein